MAGGRQRSKRGGHDVPTAEDHSDDEDMEMGHKQRRKKKSRKGWLGPAIKFMVVAALVFLLAMTPTIIFVTRQQSTHKHDAANTGAAQPLPVSQPRDVLRAIPGFTSLLSQPAQVAQPSKPAVAPIVHVDITAAARAPPPPPVAAPSKAVQPAPKPAAMPERRDGAKPSSGGGVWVVSAEMQALLAEQPSLSEEQKARLSKQHVTFVPTELDQNCADACEKKSAALVCEESWFPVLNDCRLLQTFFPDAQGCLDNLFGNDLPAFNSQHNQVLKNANAEVWPPTCESQGPNSRRICACEEAVIDREKEAAEFNQRLGAEALRQLKGFEQELAVGKKKAKLGDWWMTHKPANLIESIETGHVTFVAGDRGEACFYACRRLNLICRSYWFDIFNNCHALRAAFPKMKTCSESFYGRDMPALRLDDMMGLVNKEPRAHAGSCGGRHPRTRRICGCESPAAGDVLSSESITYHTVYNVQANKYFEWMVRYMHFWHKDVGMPGKITRLLSAGGRDHLFNQIPTHVSPNYVSDLPNDNYSPYNKPHSLDHWLQEAKPKEDVIIIIDPDCMFVKPIDIPVAEGSPVAQQAFYSFDFEKDDIPMQIARRYCHGCTFLDPIAVPIIIHRNDIEKIAPLWLTKTVEIRADMDNWLNGWWNTSVSGVQLGWTAEMFGYVFAASELGIRHEIWALQSVPKVHQQLDTPIIHFHVDVPLSNGKTWYKHWDNAGETIIWPLPADTNEVTRTFLTKIKQAYDTIGPSNYTWPNPHNKYELEIR